MTALVRAVTTSSAVNSTSQTFTKPTGTVSGDLMLLELIINGSGGTAQPNATPSGWTKLDENLDSTPIIQIWYKQAGGSEPASYDFGWSTGFIKGGGIVTIRSDASLLLGIQTFGKLTNTSSTNRTFPTVTLTSAAMLVMMMESGTGGACTPPGTSTEQWDSGITLRLYCMTEAIVSAGATGTRVATGGASTSKTYTIAVGELITNGAASITLGAVTVAAAGTVAIKGAASITVGAVTLSATGNVATTAVTGSAAITIGSVALSAAGTLTVPPVAPSSLTATAITASQIDLAWVDADVTAGSYSVERSTNALTGFVEIGTTASKSYSDTGLTSNTTYYYKVRAIKA